MIEFFKKRQSPNPASALAKDTAAAPSSSSWLQRLRKGLSQSRSALSGLFSGRRVDEELLEDLHSALVQADCGVPAADDLMAALRLRLKQSKVETAEQVRELLAECLTQMLLPLQKPLQKSGEPWVLMVVGVNGAGKTTSIGKLATFLRNAGHSVLLAAGDTFRAAAREQLSVWADRVGVDIISQQGGDPGSVVFDAIKAATARKHDVVIADTAGRLPTQLHLMEELKKIKRVMGKAQPDAQHLPPHEVLLVLDGSSGQNALAQLRAFDEALQLTGLIVTKLDGTAKGGVLAAIAREQPLPVYFIGVGEQLEDLQAFDAKEFAQALLSDAAPQP